MPQVAIAEPQAPNPRIFRTADLARILGMTTARVRAAVDAGLCRPERSGRVWEFSFQDLVVMRAAQGLLAAKVPPRRVRRALLELRRQLPADRPLSGVRIYADSRQVVVRAGRTTWRPETGQVVFSFDVDELARAAGAVILVPKKLRGSRRSGRGAATGREDSGAAVRGGAAATGHGNAEACFERALRLEAKGDRLGARGAYQKALEIEPQMVDAYINLGRLLHEDGSAAEAARLYHLALECTPDDAIAHYNLALALEDLRQMPAAVAHYKQALDLDPEFADAHFNLGRLLDRIGQRSQALRHLLTYRRLTGDS